MNLSKFWILLFLIVGLVFADDTANECEDKRPSLDVKRDMSVAGTPGKGDNQFLWSSIVTMGKENDAKDAISDEQIVAVAHKASEEMRETWTKGIKPGRRPSVMTALRVGEEIYLASSIKGDYSFIYENNKQGKNEHNGNGEIRNSVPNEIKDALEEARCQAGDETPARTNVQHKNDASCGELMASYTYLLKNSNKGLRHKQPKPQVIAWLYREEQNEDKAWDPCGNEQGWGCDLFCSQMGFKTISASTKEAENFPKITKTEQQEIMTRELRAEIDQRKKEEDEEKKKIAAQRQAESKARKDKVGEERRKKAQENGKMKNQDGKGKHARAWIS